MKDVSHDELGNFCTLRGPIILAEHATEMDALRISPRYSSRDWVALRLNKREDWPLAADMVKDRLDGRFLSFATRLLKTKYSGFVVLAIDCLLAETIQQFKCGVTDGHGMSRKLINAFLEEKHFQPDFNAEARKAFYQDIRCGLLHQAEAKRMWLIRRKQSSLLQRAPSAPSGDGYIIDVERFHAGVRSNLDDYLADLVQPANSSLRSKLWAKMDKVVRVRTARGALYEAATKADADSMGPRDCNKWNTPK